MKIKARLTKWGDSSNIIIRDSWSRPIPDDASGREMVIAAMQLADWPSAQYRTKLERYGEHISVEVDIKEKPNQLITLTIHDPYEKYKKRSFSYVEPFTPQIAKALAKRITMVAVFVMCIFAFLVIIPLHLLHCFFRPEKAKHVAVAIDRAANGALNGNHNETISSRANRAKSHGIKWGCVLCKFLDWFKKGHCEDSAGK